MINNDLIQVSTSEAVEIISASFFEYSKKNIINEHPAIFFKGSPGIGKSDAVKQIKISLEQKTRKLVNLIDIRLILFNPVDLRGIPIANREEGVAIWLKPEIFKLKEGKEYINILFLDELTSSPKSIQAAAYQIALDKRLGEHKLPNNTFVLAAGNKESDNGVVYDMPSPLQNRFIHFEIANDLNDWLIWAKENRINKDIVSFIRKYPNMLNNECYASENMLVTPRSWERLSKMLEVLGGTLNDNKKIIQSVIGVNMTSLFLNSKKAYELNDILKGKIKKIPNDIENLEQLTTLLENNITKYYDDYKKIETVLKFIQKMPTDFAIRVFRTISQKASKSIDFSSCYPYQEFIERISKKNEKDY